MKIKKLTLNEVDVLLRQESIGPTRDFGMFSITEIGRASTPDSDSNGAARPRLLISDASGVNVLIGDW